MPMVDALVGASIQIILQKALSLATEGIGVFFGFKEDLQTLKQSVSMIQAVMADAEAKQGQDHVVEQWLKRLERVAYEADNVLDELNYELLCHKVESRNKQLKKKVVHQKNIIAKGCFSDGPESLASPAPSVCLFGR